MFSEMINAGGGGDEGEGAEGVVATARLDVWGEFLSDGLHLSPSGNKFVFEKLLEAIERALPKLFS
jgi:lysophospholipase L1-like esterase